MIIPDYQEANRSMGASVRVRGKWYCAYQEERYGTRIPRYLHPTGWQRYCYWWDTKEDAERAFNRVGQNALPISDPELQEWREMAADYQRHEHYQQEMRARERGFEHTFCE